ncbi:hypothetical protein [Halospeciosus flavus]|uniref:DUF8113 domain-containing protein n=1 Tax=Halospeciosus flavus TaxID=3032283 RepID=A0ABD5Z429_9EURY|nr:hypothetical protein [Halospeciosus flavus]
MSTLDDDLERAREILDRDDLDGFFAGAVHDDELDYAFGHTFTDRETTGMQALSLLALHLRAVSEEAGVPPEQVAEDAAGLAERFEE